MNTLKLSHGLTALAVLGILIHFSLRPAQAQTSQPGTPATPPGPALVWDSESKTIDVHMGDDAGHLAFNFTNVSSGNVVISNVHPGCGCTTAQLPPLPWTIAAGTNGRIGVSINLAGKSGILYKNLTVTTDKGVTMLKFRVNIQPMVLPKMTAADRTNNLKMALGDRQAVFKGDCVVCHVKQGANKYFQGLYDADCAICHEGPSRASMVPNLHTLAETTSPDFWRNWITHGKPGTLMPAFAKTDGGPLDEMQISTLVRYLSSAIPAHPAGVIQSHPVAP